MRAAGFTLVETLAVLTVAGLAAAALPRLVDAGAGGLVRAAAEEVAATLREARGEARRSGRTARVLFDTATGAFGLEGSARPPRRIPPGAVLAVEATADAADAGGRIAIRFDAEGGSHGGRVRIALRQAAAAAEVDWLTGHVRILR
ncbi:pilus assembly FimT family protein [Falsiroseomonas sp. CW058]|uniref:pilus assembly FimT family protein n=1 Tax=Falsiroseomonas sp. CW058 TaxID=3388664 RepID=UPI003D31E205